MANRVTKENYQDLDDNVRAVVDKVCLKVSNRNYKNTNLKEGEIITNRDVTIAFFSYFVEHIDENLFTLFTKVKEQKVASAFITVFKSRRNPDMIFNKKALWIYIREITGLEEKETPIITRVVKKLKIIYADLFAIYSERGYI